MNSLTSICYVCLKTKDKPLVNINSSLSANKDILHIIGYLPCNLAWLKTEALVLICEECCRRLRETYLFFAMCLTNSAVLRGYMGKLNTASGSHADCNSDEKSEIKLGTEAVTKQEIVDALVNVDDGVIIIEDPREDVDDKEESLMDNKSIDSGSGQVHQQYRGSGVMVQQGKKRTKAYSGSGRAKNSKETGTSAGKECAMVRAGMSAKQVLTKKAYKRYLKDVAEYARWMKPQEQQQQQKAQRKLLEKQKKLQKLKRKVFRKLLSKAKLHANSTYQDFVKQYGQDERFQGVASPEDLFREHVNKLRKLEMKAEGSERQDQVTNMNTTQQEQQEEQQQQEQQEEQQQQQEQQEEQNSKNIDFRKLLAEANLHDNSRYQDFAKEYGQDARFQRVVKWASRTSLFREYLNQVRNRKPRRQKHVFEFIEEL